MIESFEIQNYRLFKHLKIEKLGRVNLITGKNNVGKTALLEATHLFSSFNKLVSIKLILSIREELTSHMDLCVFKLLNNPLNSFQNGIKISDKKNSLSIETVLFVEVWNEDRSSFLRRIINTEKDSNLPTRRGIRITFFNISKIYPLDQELINSEIYLSDYALYSTSMKPCFFVFSSGLGSETSFDLWDKIALTSLKNDLINNLHLISPEIEDIAVTSHPEKKGARQFMCKIKKMNEPVLLTSMGEGTKRLLEITLALINTQNGVLLIDEIENGIHYSIHQRLWEIILDFAEKLNVQVFATTHSWDCIDGFQRALKAFHEPSQGLLLRLSKRDDEIIATSFDDRELAIATRENIEVR